MSGHSKFSNIKHKKESQDKNRSKVFLKITRQIMVAVQKGGPDPATNPSLRLSIAKANAANMPKSNYQKAITRASHQAEGGRFQEFTYEGYSKGGAPVLVNCVSDNHNRTAASIKAIFNRAGGSLGQTNSVAHLFTKQGVIIFDDHNLTEDMLLEGLLQFDIIDFVHDASAQKWIVYTSPKHLQAVSHALKERFQIDSFNYAEVRSVPKVWTHLEAIYVDRLQKLLMHLENDDDVVSVAHNCADLGLITNW